MFFLDYIAVPKVDEHQLGALVKGVSDGCGLSGCALIGGETAEMPGVYATGEFDMAGFAVGVVELKRAIDPTRMEAGDVVLGLASSGVHSNGYSLVRKVVDHAGLDLNSPYSELEDDRPLGKVLLEPTRIYAQSIVKLLRAYKVKRVISGMAHITGGGLAQNVERSLPKDVDALIDLQSWRVPPVFEFLQRHGSIDDDEMHRVFTWASGTCSSFAQRLPTRLPLGCPSPASGFSSLARSSRPKPRAAGSSISSDDQDAVGGSACTNRSQRKEQWNLVADPVLCFCSRARFAHATARPFFERIDDKTGIAKRSDVSLHRTMERLRHDICARTRIHDDMLLSTAHVRIDAPELRACFRVPRPRRRIDDTERGV